MGVVHFMGLGLSVGAVTCAVDYIEHCLARRRQGRSNQAIERLFAHSGGITHKEKNPGYIEEIVFVTTREVTNGDITAYDYQGNPKPKSVRSELVKVMKEVWRTQDKDMGRRIRWCEVNPNNFFQMLERLILLGYLYKPTGKQGKEIWCNLTGGMNPINIALISMARFTGVATHLYLIDQSKEIQKRVKVIPEVAKNPKPNEDNYFVVVPFFSTHLTTLEQLEVLLELEAESHPISNEQLWSRLRANAKVSQQNPEAFKREILLKLYGMGLMDYREPDGNLITEEGKIYIGEMKDLEDMINLRERLTQPPDRLQSIAKTWPWLSERESI